MIFFEKILKSIKKIIKINNLKMPTEKQKLKRTEKRLLKKIKSYRIYKIIVWIIFSLFWFKKIYLSYKKNKKKKGIISLTTDEILWKKISYIDDFVVDKKARGKWIWKILFEKALQKAEKKEKSDYIFLVTKKDRKVSHSIYKKYWFSLIAMWIWYLAYKKRNKK